MTENTSNLSEQVVDLTEEDVVDVADATGGYDAGDNEVAAGASGDEGQRSPNRPRPWVIAIAAALVLASVIGGATLFGTKPAAQQQQPVEQNEEEGDDSLAEADVLEIAGKLTFAGTDVSAPVGSECSIESGRVMLTSPTGGDLAVEVSALARRSAALAAALEGATVSGDDLIDVTCVATKEDGTPLMAVTCTPESQASQASTGSEDLDLATLMAGVAGWAMSDEAYDAIGGEASGAAQSGGAVPIDANGTQIVAVTEADPQEEPQGEEATSEADQVSPSASAAPSNDGTTSTGSGSAPSGGTSTSTDSGSASSGGGSQQQPSKPAHTHSYNIPVYGNQVWVVDVPASDEPVYETVVKISCTCGALFDSVEEWGVHNIETHDMNASYGTIRQQVQVGTNHVAEQGHYETPIVGYKCSCGAVQGQ